MPLKYSQMPNGDLCFEGADGAAFWISVYEQDVIRVRCWPMGTPHPHMLRTWSVVDSVGRCPAEGHDRNQLESLRSFSRPSYRLSESEGYLQIDTGILNLKVSLTR